MAGAKDLVAWLSVPKITAALVTHNAQEAAMTLADLLLPHQFDAVIGRDYSEDDGGIHATQQAQYCSFSPYCGQMDHRSFGYDYGGRLSGQRHCTWESSWADTVLVDTRR